MTDEEQATPPVGDVDEPAAPAYPAHWAVSVDPRAVCTDPDEIARIRREIAAAEARALRPWWARLADWLDALERRPGDPEEDR